MVSNLEFFPIITAFLVAIILLVVMTPLAHQFGLVDTPTKRKQHDGMIPLTGGIAIYIAVLVASYCTDLWFENEISFFTASAIIVLLGMLDDRFNLSPQGRLLCQFIVATIMAWVAQNHIVSLGNISGFGEVNLQHAVGYLFTLVCVVGVINAFNMIDGIDGLAGGMSIITLASLLSLMVLAKNYSTLMVPLILMAAIIPFLAFNLSWKGFKGNKIFMGDSGSMFMGLTIVWLLVDGTQNDSASMRPITAVWLIGLPLMDMAAVMFRRLRKGKPIMRPDRFHLHNIFMRAGFSSRRSLTAILILACAYASIAIISEVLLIPEAIMFWLFIASLFCYISIMSNIWKILRFLRR